MGMKILEKLLAAYSSESVNEPYAFICNKKTWKKLAPEPHIPGMFYGGIPIFIEEGYPDYKVLVVDKETFLKIKKYKNEKIAFWKKIMIDAAGKYGKNKKTKGENK